MRRHCGRPGCSALATVTFSFDAAQCVVWLNPISDGAPRAGDLCTRHADAMAPPKGWERIDRRLDQPAVNKPVANESIANTAVSVTPPASKSPPAPSAPVAEVATAATSDTLSVPTPPPVAVGDDLLPHRPAPKRKRRKRWDEVPSLFGEAPTSAPQPALPTQRDPQAVVAPVIEPEVQPEVQPAVEQDTAVSTGDATDVSWLPRNATNEDLDRVLDAATPMLARAFRNARPLEVEDAAREASTPPRDGDDT